MNCLATVVLPPNARGEMLLRIRDKNVSIHKSASSRFLTKDALYPGDDYDLDIVLDTWDNRKKRKQVAKGHAASASSAAGRAGRVNRFSGILKETKPVARGRRAIIVSAMKKKSEMTKKWA
jgi:hypothetical protein